MRLTPEERAEMHALGVSTLATSAAYMEPRWDYLPEPRAIVTRRHRPTRGEASPLPQVARAWRLPYEGARVLTGTALGDLRGGVHVTRGRLIEQPDPAVVMATSTDPMGAHRWALALEHAATEFLAAHGYHEPRPDVWSARHHSHVAKSEPIAYRGEVRYQRPQPCRYGAGGTDQPAVTFAADGTAEYLTVDLTATLPDPLARVGWRGHRRIAWTVRPRTRGAGANAKRAAAKVARAAKGATGKRGKAVGPWSLSARSLPRVMARADQAVRDQAEALEAMLRTAAESASLTFSDGTVVTVLAGGDVTRPDGAATGVRDWARRAALAGVTASLA